MWFLAASEGMLALFEQRPEGALSPIASGTTAKAPVEQVMGFLSQAVASGQCSQLVLVGSKNDIAWTHALLSNDVALHVMAEINYPLLPAWLREEGQAGQLQHALEHLTIH